MQLKFQLNYKWINYKFAQFSKEKCDVGVNLCPFRLILKKMNFFFFKCVDTRNRDAILEARFGSPPWVKIFHQGRIN